MMLKDVRIGLENVVADPTKESVQIVGARSDTDKDSKIIGVRLEALTRRGSRNPVKFPLTDENSENMEKVKRLLNKQDTVSVRLVNPVVMPYALVSNGNLISGVSIKADSFTIVEPDADEDLLG